MNKIITCPDECGFCDREDNYRDIHCKHIKSHYLLCDDPNKFPHACPLDDAPMMNMSQVKSLLRTYLPNMQADHILDKMFFKSANKNIKR